MSKNPQILLNKKLNGVPVRKSNDVIVEAMQEYAQSQLQEIREEAESLKGKRAGSQEYERGYARGLSDVLNLIDQLED